jgi:RNA polymerase sigma factor (sigma-70 family)
VERYLRKMVRDKDDAEDLVQETFLRASRSLGDFRGEAEPSTWLYRIATTVCLDFYRRRRAARRDAARLEEGIDPEDLAETAGEFEEPRLTAEILAETSEMGRCVREYVDSLPESFRAALVLQVARRGSPVPLRNADGGPRRLRAPGVRRRPLEPGQRCLHLRNARDPARKEGLTMRSTLRTAALVAALVG